MKCVMGRIDTMRILELTNIENGSCCKLNLDTGEKIFCREKDKV